ncbi:alpha-L-fucosidase [Thermostilla marina]
MKRRDFLKAGAVAAAGGLVSNAAVSSSETPSTPCRSTPQTSPSFPLPKFQVADGPFDPNWESLRAGYRCPEWFRDAKLGFWAHWGPQSQAEAGDWYTRHMYLQGHPNYQHHLENYGHPSVHGAKDLMCAWKAEHFDPEDLISLYKAAGGRYFAFMVNHHDNFDSWDSKYQPWNCVNIGPKKDLCRMWADTARKHGLRFGVTFHNTPYRCWNEFMPLWYGSDKEGPLAGVPYDGAVVSKEDGIGTPWEGLDPRDLYGPVHEANSPCPQFVRQCLLRVDDLLRKYDPDLLYFDDAVYHLLDVNESKQLRAVLGMPDLIPQIAAHYYNLACSRRGRLDVVLNVKHATHDEATAMILASAVVNDFEVVDPDRPFPNPWQTDISVGSWHYRRNDRYRSPSQLIRMLVNIVANNGNMLLGVPPRGDGRIDDEARRVVEKIGEWMRINGEAIHATRPWKQSKEGDIRFTRSKNGESLYAVSLSWSTSGKVRISNAALDNTPVADVALLGHAGPLAWRQTETLLEITLPPHPPCEAAYAFRIRGQDRTAFADT